MAIMEERITLTEDRVSTILSMQRNHSLPTTTRQPTTSISPDISQIIDHQPHSEEIIAEEESGDSY
jgi:hypothetical protein